MQILVVCIVTWLGYHRELESCWASKLRANVRRRGDRVRASLSGEGRCSEVKQKMVVRRIG